MAIFISEHLNIETEGDAPNIEFYLNDKGEIFMAEIGEDVGNFFMTIKRDDWQLIKKFIDNQFKKNG